MRREKVVRAPLEERWEKTRKIVVSTCVELMEDGDGDAVRRTT